MQLNFCIQFSSLRTLTFNAETVKTLKGLKSEIGRSLVESRLRENVQEGSPRNPRDINKQDSCNCDDTHCGFYSD